MIMTSAASVMDTRFRTSRTGDIDFSRFVDYSTSPQPTERYPIFLVTDISRTIFQFSNYPSIHQLLQKFPLRDIIESVLSISIINQAPGSNDYLWSFIEEKFLSKGETLDIDHADLFFQLLTESLDQEICQRVPFYLDNPTYVFYKWIDPYSICLCDNERIREPALGNYFTRHANSN